MSDGGNYPVSRQRSLWYGGDSEKLRWDIDKIDSETQRDQQPGAADREGILRAQLLRKLVVAQAELALNLSELRGSGADSTVIAQCEGQIGTLLALQQSLSGARPQALADMGRMVERSITTAQNLGQQARMAAVSTTVSAARELAAASAATRREVSALQDDLFGRRIFDRHLSFASPEEKEAYERREAENRRYIEQQLALNTPQGDLNAAGATMGQMLDAHAHGAGASPDFLPKWNSIMQATRRQREAMRAAGQSTEEFDRNLVASVRRYLEARGLSPAEIDAALARSADPLDAVAPYLQTAQQAHELEASFKAAIHTPPAFDVPARSSTSPITLNEQAAEAPSVEDVMARFRAAGVAAAPATASPEHGVTRHQPGTETSRSPE